MDARQLKALVAKLGLKIGKYVIIGSGNLAMRGIRPTEDLDLFIDSELYDNLKQKYGGEVFLYGQYFLLFYVDGTEINALCEWKAPGYQPDFFGYLIKPELIDGLPFMPLKDLYAWKDATRRDKDVKDLKLIETYWQQQKSVK